MAARNRISRLHGLVPCSLAVGLALVLLVAAGCSLPPARPPEAPRVNVMHPTARDVTEYEEFNGALKADQTVEVRSRVRGHIVAVKFDNGQVVNPGDVLFVLDPRDFDAAVGRDEDHVKVVEAQFRAAEAEARRQQILVGKATSQADYEKAMAEALSLQAQVSAARNELARARLEKEYSEIKAEIGGRIGAANLSVGNLVNAGGSDPLLATIVGIDPIRVVFNVDERSLYRFAKNLGVEGVGLDELLARLRKLQPPARIEFRLNGEKEFNRGGDLVFADNRIDPDTGTLQFYALAENKDKSLLPGSSVRVRLAVGKPVPSLLVPETCILADQDKRYVLVAVEKDGKTVAESRSVTLGKLTDDALRVIEPAVKPPEGEDPARWWVLTDNLQRVRVNYPVDTQKPAE